MNLLMACHRCQTLRRNSGNRTSYSSLAFAVACSCHADRAWLARSLSEMRKDSTTLIRKYLDEMKRLEQELALYRRGNKQLKEELKEAKDDLQKDEEIFEEKMREMKECGNR